MPDIAIEELLAAWRAGTPQAAEELLTTVYRELRLLAVAALRRERRHHTLSPTALLHETYLRLEAQRNKNWTNRVHFFASAVFLMRRVLVDHARKYNRGKAAESILPSAMAVEVRTVREEDFRALERELHTLEGNDPLLARIVTLRYFGDLTIAETAALVQMSPSSLKRQLAFAKALLREGVERSRAREIC